MLEEDVKQENSNIRKATCESILVYLVAAVLIVVVVSQTMTLWDKVISPLAIRVIEIKEFSALERSAILHEGFEFADYINFIRETIPSGAKVILPPHSTRHSLTNFGFADYFLMPRELHNCGRNEIDECILRMTGDRSYIPVLSDFPPREIVAQVKQFIPYKGNFGVWAPK
jgi:hypothetical protein